MKAVVGLNGFGRTGRQALRAILEMHKELRVGLINARSPLHVYAHLFKYDSTYGRYPGKVGWRRDEGGREFLVIGEVEIPVTHGSEPSKIPWREYGVDIVLETTGAFTKAARASGHLEAGAKKVIISAPAEGEDITIVLGVNEHLYDPSRHHIISNASCTTNCLAPVVKVLHENFGIRKGFMSTVHAYTNDQVVLDRAHRDLRRARAAALSIIPTTTGAARAIGKVIPELEGKLHGMAYRVPVHDVSVIDFVAELEREVTAEEVNEAFKRAASGPLRGILEFCEEELVSIDFVGSSASAVVDGPSTMVLGGNMVKVVAWYDNEWGYSCRLADLAALIASKL